MLAWNVRACSACAALSVERKIATRSCCSHVNLPLLANGAGVLQTLSGRS